MNKERLTIFSDAIQAIIMTILVLELEAPETLSWSGIWAIRMQFLAYAVSFFWLASIWVDMYDEWHDADNITQPVIWWDLVMLFFSSFIPYTTNLVSEHFESSFAQALYGVNILLVTLSCMGCRFVLEKANDQDPDYAKKLRIERKWLYIDTAFKVGAIAISIAFYPPAVPICIVVTTAGSLVIDYITRHQLKKIKG